jgi:signal peptidase II
MSKRDGARGKVKRFLIVFTAVTHLLLIDCVTKELAAGYLKGSAAFSVIPGLFNFAYVENRGCAWGLLQGQVWPLAAFALIALAFLIWKRKDVFMFEALSGKWRVVSYLAEILLYAGIIGNLFDRVFRGYVIDMFDFYWGESHFPCFNVADSYICVAAGLIMLISFMVPSKEKK